MVESFSKGKNLTLSITGGSPELIVLLKTHYPADLLKTTTFSLAKNGHKFFLAAFYMYGDPAAAGRKTSSYYLISDACLSEAIIANF